VRATLGSSTLQILGNGHEDNRAEDAIRRKFDMRNSQTSGGAGGASLPSFLCIPKILSGSFDMSEIIKSHFRALRPLRLTGAFVVATSVGFMISASTAGAGDANGYVRRASCTLVRYYVAKYTAPAAEAWARSKGVTDAEINKARRCIMPQHTAQVGRTDRAF